MLSLNQILTQNDYSIMTEQTEITHSVHLQGSLFIYFTSVTEVNRPMQYMKHVILGRQSIMVI